MKPRPKTGEPRKTKQPLKIDRLPIELRDELKSLRVSDGRTWSEIEEISPTLKSWEKAKPDVLELFPGKRIPAESARRWYDIRFEQRLKEVQIESVRAREIATAFAGRKVQDLDDAVLNALGEQVFLLVNSAKPSDAKVFRDQLLKLGLLLTEFKRVEAQKTRATAEERRIKVLEDEAARKKYLFDKTTNEAAKQLGKGQGLTVADINRIRERTFGLPPVEATGSHPA